MPHLIQICCYVGAATWLLMFAVKRPDRVFAGNLVLIVFHLILLPVVMALPAPEGVKAAGYFWIFLDSALGVAEINGLKEDDVWALRLGSHLPAAIWIGGASVSLPRTGFVIGVLVALVLGLHALMAPRLPKWALLPAVPLLTAWLIYLGLTL